MLSPENLLIGGIVSTIQEARLSKITSDNYIIPKDVFTLIGTRDALFYLDDDTYVVKDIMTDYQFQDLRPTDIVLDVGSNIGAFSLMVNDMVSKVYAVEPLYIDKLNKNIELNDARNISIIPCALGPSEKYINLEYRGRSNQVLSLSLTDIINTFVPEEHVDFLKLDCEGGEFSIGPEEVINIRRIEAEVHPTSTNSFRDFENMLVAADFEFTSRRNGILMLYHAKNKNIS